jgi:16S rRNA (uracil1498-N3)-methyltransferase
MKIIPLRALPRAFVQIPNYIPNQPIVLPEDEYRKFKNVLRLGTGDEVVILPNNGTAIRARLDGKTAIPSEIHELKTESPIRITLALGISKPDATEDAIRMASEIGVAHFILFTARRSVVKWEASKFEKKLDRLKTISREACEVAFRTNLPTFEILPDLPAVLVNYPEALVLSELDNVETPFPVLTKPTTLVIGPEGGWDPREVALIKNPITLGARVLRVSTAVATACALALANR